LQDSQIGGEFDENLASRKARAFKKSNYPTLEYQGNQKGIMKLFRACKKMTVKNQSYKEEYLMIRKKARSQERSHIINKEKMQKEKSMKDINDDGMNDKNTNEKKTVRAKSIENRQKRLLEESIRFNIRLNIMKQRRAQFFAPAVKMLDVDKA
jgi:hypothetical protein